MNKKMLISVFGFMLLMFPVVAGAATVDTCYDGITGLALTTNPCPYSYVDVSETGSTTNSAIVGNWRWFNNKDYEIRNDNKLYDGGVIVGTWNLTDVPARKYTLTWSAGYIDVLILSSNGLILDGANQYGTHVSANRIGSGYSPCMASIDSDLLLNIPYLAYTTSIFGTQYLSAKFVYDPFVLTPGIYFILTDYSLLPTAPSCTTTELISEINPPGAPVDPNGPPYLDIHIPNVMLPDGTNFLWIGLRYDKTLSSATEAYFYVYVYAH